MKKHFKAFPIALIILMGILPGMRMQAQTTPTIFINGEEIVASTIGSSPYWLGEGETLEKGNLVKFISVLEYAVAPSPSGGNVLQFERVVSVTNEETVPTGKAWKLESTAVGTGAALFGGDNLGNHVATTHLTMGNSRINTVGAPTALGDAVNTETTLNGTLAYAVDAGTTDNYVVTLPVAPAVYTAGMIVNFKATNSNSGSVAATLNVNSLGAKTIKKLGGTTDLASSDITSGQVVTVIYDGTHFQLTGQIGNAAGGSPRGKARYTSSGNFTVPAGVTTVYLTMCGGGGSGGATVGGGGAGGGAACVLDYPVTVTPLQVISVTVGTGASGVSNNNNGSAGSASTFGALFSVGGGSGGSSGGSGGSGGTGSSGSVAGGNGGNGSNNAGGTGGGSLLGNGGAGTVFNPGAAGSGYGGGGAGGGNGNSSGAGSPGIVLIEW